MPSWTRLSSTEFDLRILPASCAMKALYKSKRHAAAAGRGEARRRYKSSTKGSLHKGGRDRVVRERHDGRVGDTMDVWVSAFMEREKEKNMMNMTCSAPVLPRTPERVRG